MNIPSVSINKRATTMPQWALLERQALSILSRTPDVICKMLTPEGKFYWPECIKDFQTFAYGNVDNAFEGFGNLPLLYMLGGDDSVLSFAQKEYEALVDQFSHVKKEELGIPREQAEAMGRDTMLVDETFIDMDWMHIAEANRLIYFLTMANPAHEKNRERILKFAQIHFGENPAGFESNYDREHRVFKSAFLGANGPGYEKFNHPYIYSHANECYGLPFHDVPGVKTLKDIDTPEKAAAFGKVLEARQAHSDTLANMYSTTLGVLAYIVSGDPDYKNLVTEYMQAWRDRAEGYEFMPDNAGPNGIVGETMNGKYYGGHYGWTLYHGLSSIADVMILGGESERLRTGNADFINRARDLYNTLIDRYGMPDKDGGMLFPIRHTDEDDDVVIEYYGNENTPMIRPDKHTDDPAYVRRKAQDGWFDYGGASTIHWQHFYADSRSDADYRQMKKIFKPQNFELSQVLRGKDKGSNDLAYIDYLNGTYPGFPEDALKLAIDTFYVMNDFCRNKLEGVPDAGFGYLPDGEVVYQMMRDIAAEFNEKYGLKFDYTYIYNYYQVFLLNQNVPVEALIQLTMGGMSPIYNGGLLCTDARWFDMDRRRPGLCEDTAVLISEVTDDGYTMTLANLGAQDHTLCLQGGAYGEHNIVAIDGDGLHLDVNGKWANITLSAGTVVPLQVKLERFANQPSFDEPYGTYDRL